MLSCKLEPQAAIGIHGHNGGPLHVQHRGEVVTMVLLVLEHSCPGVECKIGDSGHNAPLCNNRPPAPQEGFVSGVVGPKPILGCLLHPNPKFQPNAPTRCRRRPLAGSYCPQLRALTPGQAAFTCSMANPPQPHHTQHRPLGPHLPPLINGTHPMQLHPSSNCHRSSNTTFRGAMIPLTQLQCPHRYSANHLLFPQPGIQLQEAVLLNSHEERMLACP
jgi:hypothetical protein